MNATKTKVIWCSNRPECMGNGLSNETIEQATEVPALIPCLAFLLDANSSVSKPDHCFNFQLDNSFHDSHQSSSLSSFSL